MDELADFYEKKIHTLLKNRIIGSIFIKVISDTIVVRINSADNFYFEKEIPNFAEMVRKGATTKELSKVILIDYKNTLAKTFAKKYFVSKKENINDFLYLSAE